MTYTECINILKNTGRKTYWWNFLIVYNKYDTQMQIGIIYYKIYDKVIDHMSIKNKNEKLKIQFLFQKYRNKGKEKNR